MSRDNSFSTGSLMPQSGFHYQILEDGEDQSLSYMTARRIEPNKDMLWSEQSYDQSNEQHSIIPVSKNSPFPERVIEAGFFSDTGYSQYRKRGGKKRKDKGPKFDYGGEKLYAEEKVGTIWSSCIGHEILIQDLENALREGVIDSDALTVTHVHAEVLICCAVEKMKPCFVLKFGCIVGWDFSDTEQKKMKSLLQQFVRDPLGDKAEEDDMFYVEAERPTIRADHVHIVTSSLYEKLAYSYAFSQSTKLSVFETVVSDTIEKTKKLPEGLAKTGHVKATRVGISRQIGELFVNRFYINLHTDILDTPDIFWDDDVFADHYNNCRRYLEIPKRVEILNHRLDIIKDLYDMLGNELTIQHGYKLEWIVIYLICAELLIEVLWNILIKGILKWV